MAHKIRRAAYFQVIVQDDPGTAYGVLSDLAQLGVNLLAFGGSPVGPARTQLTLFPDDPGKLVATALRTQLELDGPHEALLVQGDDELGALAQIHDKLDASDVEVYASSGVADGRGGYGYVIHVRPEDMKRAAESLGL